ncbi:MAG: hypothetical protein K0Q72_3660 [Armatimonadetes bacterium]|jgi:hypothetical protein|nr:hypothetical protein [Armatimonadota bacterium]
MSPESLFSRRTDHVSIRLALEDWTNLPEPGSGDWKLLTQLLEAIVGRSGSRLRDVGRNGLDLYLLLRIGPSISIEATVAALKQELNDSFWRPLLEAERYTWVGGYHALSLRPGDTLKSQPLEHPNRTWKRQHVELWIKRSLPHPWHEAPTPADAGIRFVSCVRWPSANAETRLALLYEDAEPDSKEASAAGQLNTRLRIPGTGPWFESAGWGCNCPLPALTFEIPSALLLDPPAEVEVWWATSERTVVATVPCYPSGTAPAILIGEQSP